MKNAEFQDDKKLITSINNYIDLEEDDTSSKNSGDTNTNNNSFLIMPDGYNQYDFSFKIIVLGRNGVGKSCLTTKAVRNNYGHKIEPTIGFDFFNFSVKIDNKIIKLQIWDTCGLEAYKSLVANFYRNSSLAIVVYAIDNRESFDDLNMWLTELKTNTSSDVKLVLVGNKCDLEDRKVSKEEAIKYKDENNIDLFFETSAKEGINSRELLIEAAKILLKNYQKSNEELNKTYKMSRLKREQELIFNPNDRLPSKLSFQLFQGKKSGILRDKNDGEAKSCSKC